MGHLLNLVSLSVLLCALHAYAAVDEAEYKQLMEALSQIGESNEKRDLVECKPKGEECRGVVRCCGTLQCYWENGFSVRRKGECVTCVLEQQMCQRDSQCCTGMMCDKGNALWVDGRCTKPRMTGGCYRDNQCAHDCKKGWWFTGECE